MATPMASSGSISQPSEEADAVYGVVMSVTAASGGMIALFDVVSGAVPTTAAPTVVLVAALATRSARVAAWTGVAMWVLIAPMATGLAILAPMAMGVLCLAFGVGAGRLLDWIHDEWTGRTTDGPAEAGWIEDDRSLL